MSAWRLPEEKYEKLKGILRFFRDAGNTMIRKEVEAGIGLIQWITRVFPQLRPYLCFFYRILAKADPIQYTWSRSQLANKLDILDENCSFIARNVDGAARGRDGSHFCAGR